MSDEKIDDIDEKRALLGAADLRELRDKLTAGTVLQLEKRDIIVVKYKADCLPPDQHEQFFTHLKKALGEHFPDSGMRILFVPDFLEFAVIRPPKD
jgi:hypothetical protein